MACRQLKKTPKKDVKRRLREELGKLQRDQ